MADSDSLSNETITEEKDQDQDLKKRETWEGKLDFFLACVGFAVGFGNIWRFPYLCYKNGGGAFLIPYVVSVILGAFPVFFLEMAVGQYMSRGGPKAWAIVPLFQGIGLASVVIGFFQNCYYNIILAWAFYYLFSSFTSELPWERCTHHWNSPQCNDNFSSFGNATLSANRSDPVTEFWENKVLGVSDGLEQPGKIKWDLALCLLLAWIIVFACICKGIKSSGKVVYFTATAPYVFMMILLSWNCTLDGSSDGISFYLKPNLTKLTETTVWVDAGTQIFYSWAIALGAIPVLGSYNKFKHNLLREAVGMSVVNASTSFLAGFIVFTILGFMAKQQNVLVSDVAESGPGLVFIAYPKAVVQLPISPMWSILFFFMVILIGLDSQFVGVESVITAVVDLFPHILRRGHRKVFFVGAACMVKFFIGLSMVTEGGIYVFQIFDYYSGSRVLILVALCEVIAIGYCYGAGRFSDNVSMMIGSTSVKHLLPYLRFSWRVTSPIFAFVIFSLSLYTYSELTYDRPNRPTYIFPTWGVAMGWSMAAFAVVWVPVVAVYQIYRLYAMGGRFSKGDFKLLLVPYALAEHQKRSDDKQERCLSSFEMAKKHNCNGGFPQDRPQQIIAVEESKSML